MDYNKICMDIINYIGGDSNIVSHTSCITRLRITVKSLDVIDFDKLKSVEGCLGINENGDEIQIIFGPGKVTKAKEAMDKIRKLDSDEESTTNEEKSFDDVVNEKKSSVKQSRKSGFQQFMSKFSNIFVPLIGGFIAAGTLAGLASLISISGFEGAENITAYLNVFNKSLLAFMIIMVGYNSATAFGGSGVIGGILSGLFIMTYSGETPTSGMQDFFSIAIDPRGGMIGALITSIIGAKVEQFIRKYFSWEPTDIITTPMLTLVIVGSLCFAVIMPISYELFKVMSYLFNTLNSSPFGASILAGLFLPSVMMGIHQGFVPVYEAQVAEIGFNTLFPILAMAGAGQVGASLALYTVAAKDSSLRKNIRGAIIPGFLGIGEPLIYGVTLPRVKPFFTAMAGGAVGGFFVGFMASIGYPFGLNTVYGSSGLLGAFAQTSNSGPLVGIGLYLAALVISYIAGYLLTLAFGTKNIDLS